MDSLFAGRSLSALAYVLPLAGLLALASVSPLEAQTGYWMLVNFGTGWKESAGYHTLEECKKDAAAFATKYSVQAGCLPVRALEQWRTEENYQQRAARCAEQSEVEIARRPSTYFTIFGTSRDFFAFDTCMAKKSRPAG
jgi:hypothetical protein